jgi:uncharacterized protein YdaU (DUF1376 family)
VTTLSVSKSATLPMMPLWVRDHISATRCFTLAERGAYMDLLMFSWDMGALPNDPNRLALILGVGLVEFTAIWSTIRHKLVLNPKGLLVNERLERERTKSQDMKAKAAVKASIAANKRWGNDAPSTAHSNASSMNSTVFSPSEPMLGAMLEQCPPSSSPSPPQSAAPSPSKGKEFGRGTGKPLKRGTDPLAAKSAQVPRSRRNGNDADVF